MKEKKAEKIFSIKYLLKEHRCVICGKKLKKNKVWFTAPYITANHSDPFFIFNNSNLHLKCFEKWKFRSIIEQKFKDWLLENPEYMRKTIIPDELKDQLKSESQKKKKKKKEEKKKAKKEKSKKKKEEKKEKKKNKDK